MRIYLLKDCISDSVFQLAAGRPTADPLFSSAALCFGPNVTAIVLTGALSDGADGAFRIAEAGGRVLVQDDKTAPFFDIPHRCNSSRISGLRPAAHWNRARPHRFAHGSRRGCLVSRRAFVPIEKRLLGRINFRCLGCQQNRLDYRKARPFYSCLFN